MGRGGAGRGRGCNRRPRASECTDVARQMMARAGGTHHHTVDAEAPGRTHGLPRAAVWRVNRAAVGVVPDPHPQGHRCALGAVVRRRTGVTCVAPTGQRLAGGGASGAKVPRGAGAVTGVLRQPPSAPKAARFARLLHAGGAVAAPGARRRAVAGGARGAHRVLPRCSKQGQPAASGAKHGHISARMLVGKRGARGAEVPRRALPAARCRQQRRGCTVDTGGAWKGHPICAVLPGWARRLGHLVPGIFSSTGQREEPRGSLHRPLSTLHAAQQR